MLFGDYVKCISISFLLLPLVPASNLPLQQGPDLEKVLPPVVVTLTGQIKNLHEEVAENEAALEGVKSENQRLK